MNVSTYRPAMRSASLSRLVATVAELTTAQVVDRYAEHAQVLDLAMRSFGRRARFLGPARTVRYRGDRGLVEQLLSGPGTGSVLVVDGGGDPNTALLGDRLATTALGQGWGGLVIDGAVRDVAQLETIGLGITATATSPRGGTETGRGEVDVPVVVGGVEVRPGDVVVADRDGVVVLDHRGLDPSRQEG